MEILSKCKHCSRDFKKINPKMVYCSTSCRINAHRMKERLLKKLNYSEQNRLKGLNKV